MPADSTTRGFRILAAVGCVAFLLLVVAPFILGYVLIREAAQHVTIQPSFPVPATSTSPGLGDLGYRCGGTARLPCGAGLICSSESSPTPVEGVCVQAVQAPTSTTSALQKDGPCQPSLPRCDQGYACVPQGSGARCASIDTNATLPRILSVKLVGMSPTDGLYQALPGTKVTIEVQAANAVTMEYRFSNGDGGKLDKSKGGAFSGTFVVPRDLKDSLTIIASSSAGASALWLRVASVQ